MTATGTVVEPGVGPMQHFLPCRRSEPGAGVASALRPGLGLAEARRLDPEFRRAAGFQASTA